VRPELVDELVAHYRAALGQRLVGLAMFGSRARGDARPESDLDLLLIAEGLPHDRFDRAGIVRAPSLRVDDPSVSVRALLPEEYERDIAPIDLDIGLDAVVLHDRNGYLAERLETVRKRIEEAGLLRAPDLTWGWRRWPTRADWAVTWEGVRL
jgi:predicted nucleotidyltransferase